MNLINELRGNPLRIITFLYRHPKGSSFATRGNIATRFYVKDRLIDSSSNPDEDINFLFNRNLINREERNLWLTNLGFREMSQYLQVETALILKDIINVNYDFALLRYLNRRNEFINGKEFPKILEDFAPFLNNFNLPSGMLIDNLFKLKNYIEEKNHWYQLNDFGKQYLALLISKRKKEIKKEKLEALVLSNTVTSNKFQRVVTYISLTTALVAILIPLFIFLVDRDKKVNLNTPEVQQLLQTQKSLQKSIEKIQQKLVTKDSTAIKVKIAK